MTPRLGIRWTIGDVSARGFEALALSIEGAQALFGRAADYVACVNTIDVATARRCVGSVADRIEWHDASHDLPSWLLDDHLEPGMAEGVAWKLAPVRLFPNRHELSLDNDVIIWDLPQAVRRWLNEPDSLLIAEDVRPCYGQFQESCPPAARNSGIRGLPPHFDAGERLHDLLRTRSLRLESETDEQGLQVMMVAREKHHVVRLDEVTICSYFRPHLLHLGTCGAHFVGINANRLPYEWNGYSGEQYIYIHWDHKKAQVAARIAAARQRHANVA